MRSHTLTAGMILLAVTLLFALASARDDVTDSALGQEVSLGDTACGGTSAQPPTPEPVQPISPTKGGDAADDSGTVRVSFDAGDVLEPTDVRVERLYGCNRYAGSRLVLKRFEIDAFAPGIDSAPVTEFANPVTLTVLHSDEDLVPVKTGSVGLYRLDEATGEWISEPSVFDRDTGALTAELDHFSVYTTQGDSDIIFSPQVQHFQVDMHSGAAGLSLPIALPSGPGGFKPDLALSYSSSGPNEMKTNQSMAGWVGAGWSLATPMVIKDHVAQPEGYPQFAGRYYISMSGVFDLLVRENNEIPGQPGWYRFHTKTENFLYIKGYKCKSGVETYYDFIVRTKDGTEYQFGSSPGAGQCTATDGMNFFSRHISGSWKKIPYRINVKRITDARGNYADFNYWEDIREDFGASPTTFYDRASYPAKITWGANTSGGGHIYQVVFNQNDFDSASSSIGGWDENFACTGCVGKVRFDAPLDSNPACHPHVMETRRLTKVEVKKIAGNQTIREYVPTYSYDGDSDPLGGSGCAVSGNYRLESWADKGLGGSSTLKTMTFDYIHELIRFRTSSGTDCDGTSNPNNASQARPFLSFANNGLGGKTTFAYQSEWAVIEAGCGWDRRVVSTKKVETGANQPDHWLKYDYGAMVYDLPPLTPKYDAEFRGFATVKECQSSSTCSGVERLECDFETSDFMAGAPKECDWLEGASTLIKRITNFYQLRAICTTACNEWEPPLPEFSESYFVMLDRTDTRETGRQPSGSPTFITQYTYDDTNQNLTYGNVTDICVYRGEVVNLECGVASGAEWYAHTKYTFYPNTAKWIVGLPAIESTWSYNGSVDGEQTGGTIYYYDQSSFQFWIPPTEGLIERVQQLKLANTFIDTAWFTYDFYGNKVSETDGRGNTATLDYDCNFTTVSQRSLGGLTTTIANNCLFQRPETTTDPNGQKFEVRYDTFGRIDKEWLPGDSSGSPTTDYTYTSWDSTAPSGVHIDRKEAAGLDLEEERWFDGAGRLIQTRSETNGTSVSVVHRTFDRGFLASETIPYASNTYSYGAPGGISDTDFVNDVLGRVTRTTNPDGTFRTIAYTGDTTVYKDEEGVQLNEFRDDLGRVWKVTEHNSGGSVYHTTTYDYDTLDRLTDVSDGPTITYYDIGWKKTLDDPDGGLWSYTYFNDGLLDTQTDPRGVDIAFQYDALGRVDLKSYDCLDEIDCVFSCSSLTDCADLSDNLVPSIDYEYDAVPTGGGIGMCTTTCYQKGHLSSVTDWAGEHFFAYDARGRVKLSRDVIDGDPYDVGREYDSIDRLTELTYPGGEEVDYTYDAQGLPKTMISNGVFGTLVDTASYNVNAQPTEISLDNGKNLTFAYQPSDFRLASWSWSGGPSPDVALTYEDNGNVSTLTDSVGTRTFNYDHVNRLDTVTLGGNSFADYDYDELGNITKKLENPAIGPRETQCADDADDDGDGRHNDGCTTSYSVLAYIPNRPHRLLAANGVNPGFEYDNNFTANYSYDEAGNLLEITAPSDPELGLLLSLTNRATGQEYDAEGRVAWISYNKLDQASGKDFTFYEQYEAEPKNACRVTTADVGLYVSALNSSVDDPPPSEYDPILDINNDGIITTADVGFYIAILNADCPHFIYDYTGNLTRIDDGGSSTYGRVYVGGIYELADDGTITKYYEFGGRRVAMRVEAGVNDDLFYLANDHLGGTGVVMDDAGGLVSETTYQAFGNIWTEGSAAAPTDKLFTGYQRHGQTSGLYYAGARFYSADIGRFISPDPLGLAAGDPTTVNPYTYAANNPMRFTDPTGLCHVELGYDQVCRLIHNFEPRPTPTPTATPGPGAKSGVPLILFGLTGVAVGTAEVDPWLVGVGAGAVGLGLCQWSGCSSVFEGLGTVFADRGFADEIEELKEGAVEGILDDPEILRGVDPDAIKAAIPRSWVIEPNKDGTGWRAHPKGNTGKQIRVSETGYADAVPGNVHAGPYAVVSDARGPRTWVPLEGNQILP